jgi:PPOX class probable F420-dependent enzyme
VIRDDIPESHRDLVERPLTAGLTTIDGRGRPQTTAVWFLLDEDGILKASTTTDRQKYRNLAANPQCGLFIIDPENPYRTVEVRAEATLIADPGDVVTRRFTTHYDVPHDRIYSHGDRYVIELHPWKVTVNPPAES